MEHAHKGLPTPSVSVSGRVNILNGMLLLLPLGVGRP